jgi:hypothetical protein
VQPHALKREFELRAGEATIASLEFRSTFGSLASAESGDGSWTFKRVGFWRSHVTVRESGSETDLAVFRNNTWSAGGTLELAELPWLVALGLYLVVKLRDDAAGGAAAGAAAAG